jgi:hypothetical protein
MPNAKIIHFQISVHYAGIKLLIKSLNHDIKVSKPAPGDYCLSQTQFL